MHFPKKMCFIRWGKKIMEKKYPRYQKKTAGGLRNLVTRLIKIFVSKN